MLEITNVFNVLIVFCTIYGLFDLFVRRRERMAIIEKMGERLEPDAFNMKVGLPRLTSGFNFSALKWGCLLLGIGLGLLVGFIIQMIIYSNASQWDRVLDEAVGVAYGASVLLCGGIGLLVAFFVELKLDKEDKQERK